MADEKKNSREKRVPHISPERRDRFTWHVGDLKFLTAEEFEQVKQSGNFIDYGVLKEPSEDDGKE